MNNKNNWTTIIEAIVVMVIVLVWVVWTFSIYDRSQKLATATQHKLEAIWIAREWLELVSNIRDTNLSLFAANTKECWLVNNYNSSCITQTTTGASLYNSWSYSLILSWATNRYTLSWASTWNFSDTNYKNAFRVNKDSNWYYIQWTWSPFKPLYTREIQLSYTWADYQKVIVKSIVKRVDSSKTSGNYQIVFDTLLTNWK